MRADHQTSRAIMEQRYGPSRRTRPNLVETQVSAARARTRRVMRVLKPVFIVFRGP